MMFPAAPLETTDVAISGTPGVGKTLTAEAVSEHLQRPLYWVRKCPTDLAAALF